MTVLLNKKEIVSSLFDIKNVKKQQKPYYKAWYIFTIHVVLIL